MMIKSVYRSYLSFKPFTKHEAIVLFKLAAIAEAVGWTILISGLLITKYLTLGNNDAVQIAGRIHGTLFLIYIVAVLVLSPSLGFGFIKTIIAGLCSIPPYGSLIYEKWFTHQLTMNKAHLWNSLSLYWIYASKLSLISEN